LNKEAVSSESSIFLDAYVQNFGALLSQTALQTSVDSNLPDRLFAHIDYSATRSHQSTAIAARLGQKLKVDGQIRIK
jgi:hypothetical protein